MGKPPADDHFFAGHPVLRHRLGRAVPRSQAPGRPALAGQRRAAVLRGARPQPQRHRPPPCRRGHHGRGPQRGSENGSHRGGRRRPRGPRQGRAHSGGACPAARGISRPVHRARRRAGRSLEARGPGPRPRHAGTQRPPTSPSSSSSRRTPCTRTSSACTASSGSSQSRNSSTSWSARHASSRSDSSRTPGRGRHAGAASTRPPTATSPRPSRCRRSHRTPRPCPHARDRRSSGCRGCARSSGRRHGTLPAARHPGRPGTPRCRR